MATALTRQSGWLLALLLGVLVGACEKSPTDFPDEQVAKTIALTEVELRDVTQTITIDGVHIATFALVDDKLEDPSFITLTNSYIEQVGSEASLTLDLQAIFPDDEMLALRCFPELQARGFRLYLDSFNLRYYSGLSPCPDGSTTLEVAELKREHGNEYEWEDQETIPGWGQLDLEYHHESDEEPEIETEIEGDFVFTASYRGRNGATVFCTVRGEMRIK